MLVGTGLALGLAFVEGGGGGFVLDICMVERDGHADALRIEGGDAGFPGFGEDDSLVGSSGAGLAGAGLAADRTIDSLGVGDTMGIWTG